MLVGEQAANPPTFLGFDIPRGSDNIHIRNVNVDCGGTGTAVSASEGVTNLELGWMRIQNCDSAITISQSDKARPPNADLMFQRLRIRRCSGMGVLIGEAFRVQMKDVWADQCGTPGNIFTHAFYLNAANLGGASTGIDVWSTRSATAFRGSLTDLLYPLVWNPDGVTTGTGIACSDNSGLLRQPVVLNAAVAGGVEIGTVGPFTIESPLIVGKNLTGYHGIDFAPRAKASYMTINGGVIYGCPCDSEKGMSVNAGAANVTANINRMLIASAPGTPPTGRHDIWYQGGVNPANYTLSNNAFTTTDAVTGMIGVGRNPETYAASLGMTLDQFFESGFDNIHVAHQWIREGYGL